MSKVLSLQASSPLQDAGIYTLTYVKAGVGTTVIKVQLKDTDLPYTPPMIVAGTQYTMIDHMDSDYE